MHNNIFFPRESVDSRSCMPNSFPCSFPHLTCSSALSFLASGSVTATCASSRESADSRGCTPNSFSCNQFCFRAIPSPIPIPYPLSLIPYPFPYPFSRSLGAALIFFSKLSLPIFFIPFPLSLIPYPLSLLLSLHLLYPLSLISCPLSLIPSLIPSPVPLA